MVVVELLDGLDEAQLQAVTNPTDPVCVLAGAGSGKTRVLTRRIAWRAARGGLDSRRVLAITFTNHAADELDRRLRDLLGRDTGTTGTFHAIAWRMIREYHEDSHSSPPAVLERPSDLLAGLIPSEFKAMTRSVTTEIGWAAAQGVTPDTYPEAVQATGRSTPMDPAAIARIHARYVAEKRHRGVVDFDDLITRAVELMENDPAFARARRWRYRHLFVDEFQDVNPLQHRLLEAWLGESHDLFVVGDPNQAIYGFNGADARFLTGFTRRFPGATVVELTTNHRSRPQIVRVADAVLTPGSGHVSDPSGTPPTITACGDAHSEALAIARRVRSEHAPGHRWGSQAVLVRTHAQTAVIVDVLTSVQIPTTTKREPAGADAVQVLSFHAAKGLEWPVVHVAGLEEGLVPDVHARHVDAIAEERRLLYVATSRASRQLHLTWARTRELGGRTLQRNPSRWLGQLSDAISAAPDPRDRRRRTSDTDIPRTRAEPDSPRGRLLRWRAATARAASIPAAVVIEDAVVDELVRVLPGDLESLRSVRGLGELKASRYGTALLSALHDEETR